MIFNPLDKSGFTFAISALWGKISDKFSSLSKVAYSGKYIDLTGTPTIPTKTSQLQNDSGFKTTDTWKANTKDNEGYVAKGNGQAHKVWKTDENGNPGWREDEDTIYTHPTTAGNNHIPAGGAAGQFLKWLRDGVAQWASLGAAAFAALANNLTTTNDGFALDARVGPVIDKRFVNLEEQLDKQNSALENIDTSKIAVLKLTSALGATSYNKPWLEIKANYSAMQQTGKNFVMGIVNASGRYPFIGYLDDAGYAFFLIYGNMAVELTHVKYINNTWSYGPYKATWTNF